MAILYLSYLADNGGGSNSSSPGKVHEASELNVVKSLLVCINSEDLSRLVSLLSEGDDGAASTYLSQRISENVCLGLVPGTPVVVESRGNEFWTIRKKGDSIIYQAIGEQIKSRTAEAQNNDVGPTDHR